tara:strand:+ start:1045 stop:1230 length:186 start_codon:yes stop_codon:yes gene_type:complete
MRQDMNGLLPLTPDGLEAHHTIAAAKKHTAMSAPSMAFLIWNIMTATPEYLMGRYRHRNKL